MGDIRAIGTLPRPLNQNMCKRPDARLLSRWVKVEKPTLLRCKSVLQALIVTSVDYSRLVRLKKCIYCRLLAR